MTRTFFVLAGLLCAAMIGLFIVGLTSSSPALLMVALLLCGPGFMFTLGLAVGRASNEFSLVRKDSAAASVNGQRVRSRITTREPLS